MDTRGTFIRGYQVTAAGVHDSQVFAKLLAENTSRDLWTDSADLSAEHLEKLKALHYRSHIQRCQRMMRRNHPLSAWEKQENKTRAKIRGQVEHVSRMQLQRAGTLLIRTVSLVRVAAKIGLRNLAYNMDRLGLPSGAGLSKYQRNTAPGVRKRQEKEAGEEKIGAKRPGKCTYSQNSGDQLLRVDEAIWPNCAFLPIGG